MLLVYMRCLHISIVTVIMMQQYQKYSQCNYTFYEREIEYLLIEHFVISIHTKFVAFAVVYLLTECFQPCFLEPVIIKCCFKGITHFVYYYLNLISWTLAKARDLTDLNSQFIFIGPCGARVRLVFEVCAVAHWHLSVACIPLPSPDF